MKRVFIDGEGAGRRPAVTAGGGRSSVTLGMAGFVLLCGFTGGCERRREEPPGQVAQRVIAPPRRRSPSPESPRWVPTSVCSASQISCGGICADIGSDPYHCGRCGVACGTGEVCRAGHCRVTAPLMEGVIPAGVYALRPPRRSRCERAGHTNCGVGCVDLRFEASHCGRCGNACPAGTTCADGVCS